MTKRQTPYNEPHPVKRTVKKYKVFPAGSQRLLAAFMRQTRHTARVVDADGRVQREQRGILMQREQRGILMQRAAVQDGRRIAADMDAAASPGRMEETAAPGERRTAVATAEKPGKAAVQEKAGQGRRRTPGAWSRGLRRSGLLRRGGLIGSRRV